VGKGALAPRPLSSRRRRERWARLRLRSSPSLFELWRTSGSAALQVSSAARSARRTRLDVALPIRIGDPRFGSKVAGGTLAEVPAALIMKIFSLPKLATQSPRNSIFRARCDRCSVHCDFVRIECQSKKVLQCRHFLHSLQTCIEKILSAVASSCTRRAGLRVEVRCARSLPPVNTSLSGTLFFSVCWCIRDVVHLDSRVHAACTAISLDRRALWLRKRRRRRRRRAQ
jgi:hypothetical protein